ncbi:saccharopine dehydrogenase NADP-binding domain-containing protein [Nocardioides sp. TRM66260-LWL]|uniref:saccharopine dehydrogenase family protein n=1 Tax=Nocardioides sp. TRM66260-LWL TaxID=2874478 RepID=UPI001CC79ADB|nr:saccharopine dehydrogenase NADP-binding domain-containing protein [Nocardioides sp. TRM66260-LWL]MBZ5735159.1 saccharopine dehydrogenase NADP-binding domain-containing protein [Nocardioides sp. TRM66260-LWL]
MSDPSQPAADLDVVLFGATGFTGGLTADYLAAHGPADLRWALAGRSAARLEAVRERLVRRHPERAEALAALPLLEADVDDAASLAALVRRTKVVATTVGPYLQLGEPLLAACAEAGTDYVDLTGEPEFVDTMYVRHHERAVASGARIVHACGFDSVPHDLGVYFALRELGPITAPVDVRGVVRSNATFSGGTFHSAVGAFARARQMSAAYRARRAVEPRPEGRSVRAVAGRPGRDRLLGYWLLPLPTLDPQVIVRSAAALDSYGPRFSYSHFAGTRTLRYAAGGAAGVGAIGVVANVPPLRRALLSRVKQGEGPSAGRRERSWFTVDVVAETEGRTLHARVSGGDPGYDETAKMLAESALCLAFDDNPATAGCVTTAQAMGASLLDRLVAAGMRFEVV